jgi:(p)ppGpp synthase/HD superfamily hydrolase
VHAKFLHSGQCRRGTQIPYLAHLQAVAALVLEDGGSEDEAIAALLHDGVEDHGPDVLDRIATQFGLGVARIVLTCTDPEVEPGMSWRDRKLEHLRDLESAGPEVRRVALAEKLDNARALLRDYRRVGERLWLHMNVDPEDLLWYQEGLADLFVTERPGDMASELQVAVNRLLELASEPPAV